MVKFNEFFFFNSDQTLVEMPKSKNLNETFLVIFKHFVAVSPRALSLTQSS